MSDVLRRISFSNIKRRLSNVTSTSSSNSSPRTSGNGEEASTSPTRGSPLKRKSSKKKQSILEVTPQWIKDLQKIKTRGNEPLYPEFSEITSSPDVRKSELRALDSNDLKSIHDLISSFDAAMEEGDKLEMTNSDSEDEEDEEDEVVENVDDPSFVDFTRKSKRSMLPAVNILDEEIQMIVDDTERTWNEKLFDLCSIPNDRGLEFMERFIHSNSAHFDSTSLSFKYGQVHYTTGNEEQLHSEMCCNSSSLTSTACLNDNTMTATIISSPTATATTTATTSSTTLMHVAARLNNVLCLQYFINEHDANVNMTDAMQSTPLHHACSSGSKDAVMYLVLQKANVNAKDAYENTPLLLAMRNNYKQIMKILLDYGRADIHARGKLGETCLHIAAREGYLKRCQFLLLHCHASILRLNNNQEHVLFSALRNRSVVKLICDRMESFKALCKLVTTQNRYGMSVFHCCCAEGHLESLLVIIQEIKKRGMNELNNVKPAEEFLWDRLNEHDGKKGYACIHFAVINGHTKIVKYLALSAQVDVDNKDALLKNTPLHYAIQEKRKEICDILVLFGKANTQSKNARRESCSRLSLRMGVPLEKSPEEQGRKKKRRLSLGLVLIK